MENQYTAYHINGKVVFLKPGDIIKLNKMKANELRINNLTWDDNYNVVVITHEDFLGVNKDGSIPLRRIPLTEEWLVKFGFEEERNSEFVKFWELNTVTLYQEYYIHTSTKREYLVLENDGKNYQEIIYVHQLQNLYFCLTGEELQIKENSSTENKS